MCLIQNGDENNQIGDRWRLVSLILSRFGKFSVDISVAWCQRWKLSSIPCESSPMAQLFPDIISLPPRWHTNRSTATDGSTQPADSSFTCRLSRSTRGESQTVAGFALSGPGIWHLWKSLNHLAFFFFFSNKMLLFHQRMKHRERQHCVKCRKWRRSSGLAFPFPSMGFDVGTSQQTRFSRRLQVSFCSESFSVRVCACVDLCVVSFADHLASDLFFRRLQSR